MAQFDTSNLSLKPVTTPLANFLFPRERFSALDQRTGQDLVEIGMYNGATGLVLGSLALCALRVVGLSRVLFAAALAWVVRTAYDNDHPIACLAAAIPFHDAVDPVWLRIGDTKIFLNFNGPRAADFARRIFE